MTTLFKMGYEIFFVRLYINANTLSMRSGIRQLDSAGSDVFDKSVFNECLSLIIKNFPEKTVLQPQKKSPQAAAHTAFFHKINPIMRVADVY